MRRKSERNKAKGSPEKKVEKPTPRRTTRRRGKEVTPEPSPERENPEENTSNPPLSEEDQDSRLQSQQESSEAETMEKPVTSSELIKSVLGADEEDNGSVWKVARADASPGEIQKLKLCRQRNTSEASDSSSSKKKSNKWPDSGEGGTEEADSADERAASSKNMLIDEQSDDTSSLHPGQDSHEEVSDHKENLPETISANLSDDKTNIDQLAESAENLPRTTSNLSEQSNFEDGKTENSSANLPGNDSNSSQSSTSTDNVAEIASDNSSNNQQIQDSQENSNEPACINSTTPESYQDVNVSSNTNNECTNDQVIPTVNVQLPEEESTNHSNESCHSKLVEKEIPEQESILEQNTSLCRQDNLETISEDNKTSPETNQELENQEKEENKTRKSTPESEFVLNERQESDAKDVDMAEPQESGTYSSQQNHHKQYESSASDRSESEDEQGTERNKAESTSRIENLQSDKEEKIKSPSVSKEVKSDSDIIEPEIELSESNIEKDDILEIIDKSEDLNSSLSTSKPAKVSLKRSFSTRVSTDSEIKKDDPNNKTAVNESNQNKENHADNEQPDQKSCTKRRRWGTTTSDVAPAFSISTDSLKALVPGAKPLSVNEVKLSKDEDEEKEHRKNKNEVPDHKAKNDIVPKNDITKKTENKADNHIAPRRKITVVKEAPRPTSPSLPEAQATNVLLIKNLVRPFTLHQIKELLSRTGTILENGFWIDRIKSKCFVEYANEDQAFETRQALHGVSWPPSNPKKLIVEYATKEDMEAAWDLSKDQPIARKTEPLISADLWQQDQWSREDRTPIVNKITVIREWDLGKEDGQLHVKEKERERKEFEKKKRQRSRSPVLEVHLPAPARKFKKKEEEPPTAKLLDDLFRKTKATPCIYWLPLTNEQIIVKEEMRRQHMAEHARRLEEMRRAERSRDTRRRRSPRK